VGNKSHSLGHCTPRNDPLPTVGGLGRSQDRFGRVEKICAPPPFESHEWQIFIYVQECTITPISGIGLLDTTNRRSTLLFTRRDVATYQKTRVFTDTVVKTKICCTYISCRVSGGPETSDDAGLNSGKLLLLYYFRYKA